MASVRITGTVRIPGGAPAVGGTVTARLSRSATAPDGRVLGGGTTFPVQAPIAADGTVDFLLDANDVLVPSGTVYEVKIHAKVANGATYSPPLERWQVASAPSPVDIGAVPRLDVVPGVAVTTAPAVAQAAADAQASATAAASAAAGSAGAASDSAGGAAAAKAAAELARDAATATGKVYLDTASGIAAVADGAYFSVPAASSGESLILYRRSGASVVEVKRYPSAAFLPAHNALAEAFTIPAAKNLYDPSIAKNGILYGNSNGAESAAANYACSGLIPVQEGNRYTLSSTVRAFSTVLHFWGAGGLAQYLGGTIAGYPAGVSVVYRSANLELSFTVPVASGIRYVGVNIASVAHTADEFDAARNGIQLEVGDPKTSFETYGVRHVTELLEAKLPSTLAGASARLSALEKTVGPLKIIKAGTTLYLRCAFDATYDLCIEFLLSGGSNAVPQWGNTFRVPVATADSAVAALNGGTNILHLSSDDPAPVRYNGATIGANHGHTQFVVLTQAGHGKTTADIGSRWVDGGGVYWTIIKIPDANTLWILSDYTKAGDVWTFALAETGSLTHVSGATSTATVVPTARGTSQFYPAVKSQTKQALVNGATDIAAAADGVYTGEFLEVVGAYEITDLPSVLDYIKANPGVAPIFDAPAIATGARLSIVYRFYPNGSATVFHTIRLLKGVNMTGVWGFMQSGTLNQIAGRKLYQYIPGTLPFVGGMKTWDFRTVEEITGGVDTFLATSTYWEDANNPPHRMVQIMKQDDGTPVLGFMLAYSLTKGITVPATRKSAVTAATEIRNTKKQYPGALAYNAPAYPAPSPIPAGAYFEVVEHRAYFDQAAQPNATLATYVEDGPDAFVYLDYHQTIAFEPVKVPARFRGRTVEVVQKTASCTVHTSVVGPDGILVSISGGYGNAMLRLR